MPDTPAAQGGDALIPGWPVPVDRRKGDRRAAPAQAVEPLSGVAYNEGLRAGRHLRLNFALELIQLASNNPEGIPAQLVEELAKSYVKCEPAQAVAVEPIDQGMPIGFARAVDLPVHPTKPTPIYQRPGGDWNIPVYHSPSVFIHPQPTAKGAAEQATAWRIEWPHGRPGLCSSRELVDMWRQRMAEGAPHAPVRIVELVASHGADSERLDWLATGRNSFRIFITSERFYWKDQQGQMHREGTLREAIDQAIAAHGADSSPEPGTMADLNDQFTTKGVTTWGSTAGVLSYVSSLMHDIHCKRPKEGYTPEQEADLAALRRVAKRIGDDRYKIAAHGADSAGGA